MISMLVFRMFGDMDAAFLKLQQAVYGLFDYQVAGGSPDAVAFKDELDRQITEIVRSVSTYFEITRRLVPSGIRRWVNGRLDRSQYRPRPALSDRSHRAPPPSE